MLAVDNLHAHYGRAHILRGLSFAVPAGGALALLGRNGAGKSTTLKSLIGLVRPSGGRVLVGGQPAESLGAFRVARLGLGYVPEERRVFADLTVSENLEVGRQPPRPGLPPWTPERLFALFPVLRALRDRPAGRTSGGEQQMLSIARTLMGNPLCVLLDEPGEGLAPAVVEQVAAAVLQLKADGVAVVLAEQSLPFALAVADTALLLEGGRAAWSGTAAALRADPGVQARYLAV